VSPEEKADIESVIVEALRPVLTDIGKELSAISVGIGALLAQGAKHGEAIEKLESATREHSTAIGQHKVTLEHMAEGVSGLKHAVHGYQHAVSQAIDKHGARILDLEKWRKSQANGDDHGTELHEVGE